MSECPKANGADHCWHPTGVGYTYGIGGSEDAICCWCGTRITRSWHTETHGVLGHGIFGTEERKVYDDV